MVLFDLLSIRICKIVSRSSDSIDSPVKWYKGNGILRCALMICMQVRRAMVWLRLEARQTVIFIRCCPQRRSVRVINGTTMALSQTCDCIYVCQHLVISICQKWHVHFSLSLSLSAAAIRYNLHSEIPIIRPHYQLFRSLMSQRDRMKDDCSSI